MNGDLHTVQEKRHDHNISKNMIDSKEKEPNGVRSGSKRPAHLHRNLKSAWSQLFAPLHPMETHGGKDIQGFIEVETILREPLGTRGETSRSMRPW